MEKRQHGHVLNAVKFWGVLGVHIGLRHCQGLQRDPKNPPKATFSIQNPKFNFSIPDPTKFPLFSPKSPRNQFCHTKVSPKITFFIHSTTSYLPFKCPLSYFFSPEAPPNIFFCPKSQHSLFKTQISQINPLHPKSTISTFFSKLSKLNFYPNLFFPSQTPTVTLSHPSPSIDPTPLTPLCLPH